MRSVGLFAGIGGFELGLQRAGITPELLCEYWEPASDVLKKRFDTDVVGDICELRSIPKVDVVTAGFPCTDLSQVGRTAGIDGSESGLVREAFRLIDGTTPHWVVLENVPNMLSLGKGAAMAAITDWFGQRGWNWAYRTVDSQHFGLRQRRRRVFLVASRFDDPRGVLFGDEAGEPTMRSTHSAYGFYWTEGNRGVGWGDGVTPTLKGGSKIGIASPPGVWRPGADAGQAIARPSIRAGERLQGFRAGWTDLGARDGVRWKMVGNAVSVPVAAWIGRGIVEPRPLVDVPRRPLDVGRRWPGAASSVGGVSEEWALSERPLAARHRQTLAALLGEHGADPLSLTATRGFTSRLVASNLRRRPGFVEELRTHIEHMSSV
ncbi:DNA (cytosine-5-)-methyltransferase [Nocardioides sp. QY071]|uniref:DNA cytosine methyltransferase n=1 Tax=Nocardioides sp. QY071 TaxID=3044187 RepID=UPI00249CCB7C|nr:DNA (cytosine-5-)-methyltransferase [Nocardioides sp. QY071]WGY02176.1 DNA (cytosine-5-)-methyltransferase [Nocardioides sp. QY071]